MVRIIFIVTMFIMSVLAHSQELENSLLWKIEGNGLEKPSYLYGTIHASCDANFENSVLTALDETSQLYLEIDIDDPKLTSKMMEGMMMKDNQKITNLLSEEDVKLVDDFILKNIGLTIEMYNSMKPFTLNTMIIPLLFDCKVKSIEDELVKITKSQKEEVFGLETIEYQLAVFDEIPYKSQAEDFVKSIKSNLETDKEELKQMQISYKEQNIELLLSQMKNSDKELMTKYKDILLENRNKNWIPIIEKTSKEKPTFFAVGAGHLAGEEGVIKLLRKKGYKVEAVK